MKKWTLLLSGLVAALMLVGAPVGAQDVIPIGVYLPLTGQNAFGGQLELDGIKLAHAEMPEVLGKKVELFVVDNKSDKVEASNAVKRLIEKENRWSRLK